MNRIKKIILCIWQLPQHLFALILLGWATISRRRIAIREIGFAPERTFFYVQDFLGGISLGDFIILNEDYRNYTGNMERHEYGHSRQSRMLGPLYLLVIGLPSLLWATFYPIKKKGHEGYDRFYTERWANKLGGLE